LAHYAAVLRVVHKLGNTISDARVCTTFVTRRSNLKRMDGGMTAE